METSNLPDREFKVIVIKIFTELRRTVDELRRTSTKRYKIKKEPVRADEYSNCDENILEGITADYRMQKNGLAIWKTE